MILYIQRLQTAGKAGETAHGPTFYENRNPVPFMTEKKEDARFPFMVFIVLRLK